MDEQEVTIYTRAGCHLCEDAETLLRRLGYQFTAIDVDTDTVLRTRYGDEVPVIALNGRPVLSGVIHEAAVRAVLGG
jgi:glutaredoxin